MSNKYCLVIYSNDVRKVGSITSINEEMQKEALNPEILEIHEFSSIMEFYYYRDMDRNERVNYFKSGMFDKIKNLSPGKLCLANFKNCTVTCEILKKEINSNRITFQCKVEDLNSTIDIPAISIIKILTDEPDKTESKRKNLKSSEGDLENERTAETINDGLYILSSEYRIHNADSIVNVINGKIEINSYILTLTDDLKQKLTKIERDYTCYLLDVSLEKRIKYHKEGRFKRIKELKIGDVIYFKNEKCSVEIISKTEDGPIFSLKSKSHPYMVHKDVKACEIKFKQSLLDNFQGKRPSIKTALGQNKEAKTILCEPINSQVLDPNGKIKKIDTDGAKKFSNKFIIIRHDNGMSVVKLLWIGIIDNLICLGCELFDKFNKGTDGKFFGKQLFCCQKLFGVLIPTNNNYIDICESGSDIKHKDLEMGLEIINEESICCIEITNDFLEFNDITIGQYISYGEVLAKVGEVLWLGIVNGQKCIGIKRCDPILRQSYRNGGIISIIDIFTCQLFQAGIIKLEDAKKEKIQFKIEKIVDTTKIFYTKEINKNVLKGLKKGDPIKIKSLGEKWIGEIKWFGMINNEECVGLDMEYLFHFSMDGIIKDDIKFECLSKHGLVTLLSEVELIERPELRFLEEGIIDPNQYLRCIEQKDFEFFKPKGIKKNDFVFIKINEKDKEIKKIGKLKWYGLMNEVPVGVVELTENHEKGTYGNFWRSQLFICVNKRAIATTLNNIFRDIMTFSRHNGIRLEIISPSINQLEFKSLECTKRILILEKNNQKLMVSLLWKGFVNEVLCLGCELENSDVCYGTNGTFDSQQLFYCREYCGFLIVLNNDIGTCEKGPHHYDLSEDCEFINERKICCIRNCDTLPKFPKLKVGNFVWVRFGSESVKTRCNWIGLVNDTEAVLVDENPFKDKSARKSVVRLYDQLDSCTRGLLVLADNILKEPVITFLDDIFVQNDGNVEHLEVLEVCKSYEIGDLVLINGKLKYHGYIQFFKTFYDHVVVGIELEEKDINKYPQVNKVLFHQQFFSGGKCGVIVNLMKIEKVVKEVTFIGNSCLIDKSSIKSLQQYQSKHFKKGDVVTPFSPNVNENFLVFNSWLINGIPSLEIGKAIRLEENFTTEFLKEGDVDKVDPDTKPKYYAGAIIEPKSLLTFSPDSKGKFKNNDKVKFCLNDMEKEYQGCIILSGQANRIPSSLVKIDIGSDDKIVNLSINHEISFHLIENSDLPIVIIPNYILKKASRTYKVINGIPVLDFQTLKSKEVKAINERIIFFRYNDDRKSALVKWTGFINKVFCLGCEIGNFSFQSNQELFWIPLEALGECCEKADHRELKSDKNKIIDPRSICCMSQEKNKVSNLEMTFDVGDRVKRKMGNEKGVCKWKGFVNKVQVIGLELTSKVNNGTSGNFCDYNLFQCEPRCGVLCEASELEYAPLPLQTVPNLEFKIVDPFSIKSIENGKGCDLKLFLKSKKWINVQWKGCINDYFCIGYTLPFDIEYGTNGTFNDSKLFNCPEKKGILVPVDELKDCCKTSEHKEIFRIKDGYISPDYLSINPDCICCIEQEKEIKKWPKLRKGSNVTFSKSEKKKIDGICKWIGSINGIESVGVEMEHKLAGGTNGRFKNVDLFTCHPGKGYLFLAEDISHDAEREKLCFIVNKIVDTTKIFYTKEINKNELKGLKKGDPVKINALGENLIGELKWFGMINNEECVGLDMEKSFPISMDGTIKDDIKFECLSNHGLVTLLNEVELIERPELHFLEEGIVDPNQYLRCIEQKNFEFFKPKGIKQNDFVFIKIKEKDKEIKKKGILKWCGLMNGVGVGVVELTENHEKGTHGNFWRCELFSCSDKRAIATILDRISEYLPYEKCEIPDDIRIFDAILLNSAVKFLYLHDDDDVKEIFGTVRWTGKNEDGEYFYGIELDDRFPEGTNGTFRRQQLFNCLSGRGILAPMDKIFPDTRFFEMETPPEDVPKSEDSTNVNFAILSKLREGLNKGIQGNENSCYFDSAIFALFSKSDVLQFMISPLLNNKENDDITKIFREIISWKIIYPLREFGFVSFHKTAEMREVIKDYGKKFEEMTKQESDMENVSSLLSKLCQHEQLLSIVSLNGRKSCSMFMQLFVTLNERTKFLTSEEMLKISMVQNEIMFTELPSCLIMQAPRDARGFCCYDHALPLEIIEISEICSDYFKKCFLCENEAAYQCQQCMEKENMNISASFRCYKDKCHHEQKRINGGHIKSRSKVFMELKAIICIEKCHFVSYVKQEEIVNGKIEKQWFFFDSMSTKSTSNNYPLPKVTCAKPETQFLLNSSKKDMIHYIEMYGSNNIKRIVKDSYVFVYENPTKTCY